MSHFAVLVITDQEPTHEVLSAALQPFHEYECTGIDDQYVVDVDVTDEVEQGFAKYTYRRWVDAAGVKHDPYDDRFYRDPTDAETKEIGPIAGTGGSAKLSWSSRDWGDGKGYRTKVHMTAAEVGMTEVDVPASEVKSIEVWAKDYGGWERREDGRFIKHTNPNAQWDWWVLGGRYNGRLFAKDDAVTFKGRGGLMTPVSDDGADAVRRGDLDFEAMKANKVAERRGWVADPGPFGLPALAEGQTREQWIESAPAISAWAVLKDGEWTEKGSMGWWGISTGDKDDAEWEASVSRLVEGLDPDKWVSVVDCHI